jgi:hypothetical protein
LRVSPVFRSIGSIDFVVDLVAGIHEGDVFLEATTPDPALMALLDPPKPRGIATLHGGSDEEVITVADKPYGDWFAEPAIAPSWRDLDFFCSSELGELIGCPGCHRHAYFVPPRMSALIM